MLNFRNQYLLLIVLLLGSMLGGTYWLVKSYCEDKFTARVREDLTRTRNLFERLLADYRKGLAEAGDALIYDPQVVALLQAVAGPAGPPPQPLHDDPARVYPQIDSLLISDRQGTVRALNAEARKISEALRGQALYREVLAGNQAAAWLVLPGGLVQVLGRPVLADGQVEGGLFLGKNLQAGDLENFKSLLGADIVLFQGQDMLLSTEAYCPYIVKTEMWRGLARLLGAQPAAGDAAPPASAIHACFRYLHVPASQGFPAYVLLQPLAQEKQWRQTLYLGLLALSGAVLLLGGILLRVFDKGFTRVLGTLQGAVEQVERENYQFRLELSTRGEFASLGESFNQMIKGLEEKERLRAAMEQIVSRDLALELLKDELNLRGETKPGTVLYADIRGFSALAQDFGPEELLGFLNNYFTRMSFCVDTHDGLVDKYQGDALLAVFGIPVAHSNDARSALDTALDMLEALDLFNLEVAEPKGKSVRLGIGISTGTLIAGNLGAENRFNYSVLGDTVNVAERLQGLTKYYGVSIIIGEDTHRLLQKAPDSTQVLLHCRELDSVQLDNRAQGMAIYEVFPRALLRRETRLESLLKQYQEARRLLQRQDFQGAAEVLQKLHAAWPEDRPTAVLLARCRHYAADIRAYMRENPQGAYIPTHLH